MRVFTLIFTAVLLAESPTLAEAQSLPGDARRGEMVFREQQCIACHAIRGQGGRSAPDLGVAIGRDYTPTWMASIMWNHAPAMWAAMEQQGIVRPQLTEAQAADLFAYFHAARFFERPGDAARGKRVFTAKHCVECHGVSAPVPNGGPALASWRAPADPIALAQEMWNHASGMRDAMVRRHIPWPQLTSQELTDLVIYIQNIPETRGKPQAFELTPNAADGERLFKERSCANCHQGDLDLQRRLSGGTVTDFAAVMWNHAPRMWRYGEKSGQTPPRLTEEEMRCIISYLWYTQLYAEPGQPVRGKQVFAKKGCASCHENRASGAPDLKHVLSARAEPLRPSSIAAVLWQHGPAMLEGMRQRNIPWPRFSKSEMVNLIAYLNGPEFRVRAVR